MEFLREAFVYLAAAVIAVPLATRLGLGSVLGYLAAGAVIGPHGLALAGGAADAEEVLHAAEFGVVLLLFLIGLELEPRRLMELRRTVFGLGVAQVTTTAAAIAGAAWAAGLPGRAAIVVGLGLSLSSTAFVLQLLRERDELREPHGRAAFGILLFQDLAVIPMLALLPALGAADQEDARPAWASVLVGTAVVLGVIVASRVVARPALRVVAGLRNPELFTATALLLVVATAWAVSAAGLSSALGAFLAGALLASSAYRHELEADVAPFKGILLGLFFIAVGMTANLALLLERPLLVLGAVAALVALKAVIAGAIGWRALRAADPALGLGIVLSQGGEFAFVLFGLAAAKGILARDLSELLVLVVTLSLATTPALHAVHARLLRPRFARGRGRSYEVAPEGEPPVIIAGFGRVGQVVARVLRAKRIPFTAMDASSEHIAFVERYGNKVFYGDASRLDLLRAARADQARVFVLAIDDVAASLRTAEVVSAHFPGLLVLARARNRDHAYRLRALGIAHVIRETFASSLEMTVDVLVGLGEDRGAARAALERFRAHDEALLERSWRHAGDEQTLIDTGRRGREELERLFEQDAADRRTA